MNNTIKENLIKINIQPTIDFVQSESFSESHETATRYRVPVHPGGTCVHRRKITRNLTPPL